METGVGARLRGAEGRRFGLTVGAAVLALAGVMWWREHLLAARLAGLLGGALTVAGVVMPARLGPVRRAWMGLSHLISRVTTPVLLGAVFFLVIMPIGLVMRLSGRNPMRATAREGSFWVPRETRRGSLRNQF